MVKDKITRSLNPELGKRWHMMHPEPDTVVAQIDMLEEMGHEEKKYERMQSTGKY